MSIDIRKALRIVSEELLRYWGAELEEQGHVLTGKLVRSIEFRIAGRLKEWRSDFFVERYGLAVDTGVRPERVPFSPGMRRRERSKYIEALVRYVRQRMGIGGKKGRSIAFAIAHKHKKEGIPTKASSRFSRTGHRTGWIDRGVRQNEKELEQTLERVIGQEVERFLDAAIEQAARS